MRVLTEKKKIIILKKKKRKFLKKENECNPFDTTPGELCYAGILLAYNKFVLPSPKYDYSC